MAGKKPTLKDVNDVLRPKQIHHDIYAIGSQEALRSIGASIMRPSKEELTQVIQQCLGDGFFMVTSITLQASYLVVFASKRLSPLISNVQSE
eukprot:CAMPEP_0176346800 /NCGR_PEP_ID=MMETSP0126-20121128/6518_1 /TAXON_ID=141414 ORGANISM="Strombidinopsis acuminatum, Strain SPMC142" /NCGR_SAMPLE_ID=MMETSP0126 /ASSEMBLY_ACC=CAM_ASM_000229 /LENGTH=91 /DNA_ID=CAMNT_0017694535 /DNA_START=792 /DNA_END=1067 /DNA_ORIENTATION=+